MGQMVALLSEGIEKEREGEKERRGKEAGNNSLPNVYDCS